MGTSRSDSNITGAIGLISGITRGLFDPWIDSITIIALRRRNSIRRRAQRLKEDTMNSAQRDIAFSETIALLADSLEVVGERPIGEVPLAELGAVHWNLTVMSGLLEAELAERDGTTDMAQL